MKNQLYTVIFALFIGLNAFAQAPDWAVNENDYQYTMSFVSFVSVNGVQLGSENDKIAAFVNGECRGVTNLTYVASEDAYYGYLTLFSNENNESLSFKIYDAANDVVVDVAKTIPFEINAHYGNLFQAYSIAQPALSNQAELISLSLDNVAINQDSKEGLSYVFHVNQGVDISNVDLVFELSSGATLFKGTERLTSGNTGLDLTNPVQLQVRSEDQSVLKQWTVEVRVSEGLATFYRKNAVCFEGGAIKVAYTQDNAEVILRNNGLQIAAQRIVNGETIFTNLQEGTYSVTVEENTKEITIELK